MRIPVACTRCGDLHYGAGALCCCCDGTHERQAADFTAFEVEMRAVLAACLCPYTCPAHTVGVG